MSLTSSLDAITERARGARAAAAASLEVSLGRVVAHLEREADREAYKQRAVQPGILPAVRFTVTAGAIVQDVAGQVLLGPEDGQVWHIGRVTLAGLAAADQVGLFRELVGAGGQAQNKLHTFTGTPPNDVWEPARLFLRSPEQLSIVALSSLTATSVTLSGDMIMVEQAWLPDYLL